MTKISKEIHRATWSLLLSERQDFLNNHPAQVPTATNQERTLEMRDEVISSVGAQDVVTSGYQVSDLDDVDFYWRNDQPDVDAVLRQGIQTLFSHSIFNNFEMGFMTEKPIPTDKRHDKEITPPHPTTPVSDRPAQPAVLMRIRSFGSRIEIVPDYVFRNLSD